MIKSYMKYYTGDIIVVPTLYFDGNTALQLTTIEGEPIGKATTNLGNTIPREFVYIKDYSENEGVLDTLINANIIILSGLIYKTNHVEIPEAEIVDKDILEQIEQLHERIKS